MDEWGEIWYHRVPVLGFFSYQQEGTHNIYLDITAAPLSWCEYAEHTWKLDV